MAVNGLLTEVRWEWYGTELLEDTSLGDASFPVVDAASLSLGQVIWVGSTGPYAVTGIDFDSDTISLDSGLLDDFDAGIEVVPDIGGKPGQLWIAGVILPDAEEPIEVPLVASNLLYMPEKIYDPPVAIVLSNDLEHVVDLPGSYPRISLENAEIIGDSNFDFTDPETGEGSGSISADGDASFNHVYASDVFLGGASLLTTLANIGQGVIARSTKTLGTNRTATGSAREDLYEISAECVEGRVYRVSIDPVLIEFSPAGEAGGFRVTYETDGSQPTDSSTVYGLNYVTGPTANPDTSVDFSKTFVATETGTHRWLVQLAHSSAGGSDYARLASGREIRVIVEDLGIEPPDTGINPGDSAALTKTFSYYFDWSAFYLEASGALQDTGKMTVGGFYSGAHYYGLLGFSDAGAALQAELAGYTINYVRLFLTGDYAIESDPTARNISKASLRVHAHNLSNTSAPTTGPVAPGISGGLAGQEYWWQMGNTGIYKVLPNSFGDDLRDDNATGVRLSVPDLSSHSPGYTTYGYFWGVNHASKFPYLQINATKY